MDAGKKREYELLELIRTGKPMTWSERLDLIVRLSIPSILAQLSVIVMLYIDASMVGSLGANASASIGLVSTTTWLFSGVCTAAATGFSVQVAHLNDAIAPDASRYFLIYALSLPFLQVNYLSGSMLRCSGNMRVPSMLSVLMCVLDVIFNTLLIFPTRTVHWGGAEVVFPGAGMGVAGAALGTALAVIVTAGLMTCYLWFRSPELALGKERGSFRPTAECLRKAVRIGLPIGCEHVILCGAQILTTVIVAPLGTAAIAANAFAITAESLCYMPGYGIADAATTLVGQSKGAGRRMLTQRFARMTVSLGMVVMAFMGLVMYVAAPLMMGIMTPDPEIRELGIMALRIEAFAEPMFAASIVAYGAFIGAGDTVVPSCMNFFSIWAVRLTLAALLAPTMGLQGVWIAMCIELCFRGAIFLVRLLRGKWLGAATPAC